MTSFCPPAAATPRRLPFVALLLSAALAAAPLHAQPVWNDYAGNPQHTAVGSTAAQPLARIRWQTPVDLDPQYVSNDLLIHYGSALVTGANTVIVPVKVGATDGFRVEGHAGSDGTLLWQFDSDYSLPPHSWTPSFGPALTPGGRLYVPAAGGTLLYTDDVDTPGAPALTRVCFYGLANYTANPTAFDADIKICTPLTCDAQGNVFFGFRSLTSTSSTVTPANPLGLSGGIARIAPDGSGTYALAYAASDTVGATVLMNCAPALSNDGGTVYIATRITIPNVSRGYLLALDATTLATTARVSPREPRAGRFGNLSDQSTSSPMVAPDGRVYYGVLQNPGNSNASRGWMLQFDSALTPSGVAAAFGWDDTPSVVPASMVPSYAGASTYLLMTKYNFYAGAGGDGVNKIAILDPNDSQIDAYTGTTVMKEVLTIAGVTPDPEFFPTYPNAVREWCINSAAVDTFSRSVLANSEDGRLYRWDMATNSFTQSITLTPGVGEAYTPTVIGRDGAVYAINNATLFSVGDLASTAVEPDPDAGSTLSFSAASPNPFGDATTLRFSLPRADRVRLDILDITGRRVASLVDRDLPAGAQTVRWAAGGAADARLPAGVYLARLAVGSRTLTRTLVRIR